MPSSSGLTHRRCPKQAKRRWPWTLPQPTPWGVASGATAFCEFPSGFTSSQNSILERSTFPMIINDSMIPFFKGLEKTINDSMIPSILFFFRKLQDRTPNGFQPRWWAVVDMRWRNPVASPAPYWRPCRKLNGCLAPRWMGNPSGMGIYPLVI